MRRPFAFILAVAALVGCCKQYDTIKTGSLSDLSPFAQKFLGLNSSANISLAAKPSAGSALAAESDGSVVYNYKSISGQHKTNADSTIVIPGQDCGMTTQIFHTDGSITVIINLGDSCTQTYGDTRTTVWGKSSYTSKNTVMRNGSAYVSEYYYRSVADNLGSLYISPTDTFSSVSNGHFNYSGTSSYDTITQAYSATSSWGDSADYSYIKNSYQYLSTGTVNYASARSVVETSVYSYRDGANYYESNVTTPIVRDYSCHASSSGTNGPLGIALVIIPISGHETVTYTQDGKTGGFEIDYGDGTCDTLVTILENGKVTVIDFATIGRG